MIRVENQEFNDRIKKFREIMAQNNIDLVVGFSNLLDPSNVRYFADFSAVNESGAIIIPISGEVTVCSGQASSDYANINKRLDNSVIEVFPEIGEVSGFEYDFEGQLEFGEYFKTLKQKHKVSRIGLLGKLIFPEVIYNKLKSVFSECELVDFDNEFYTMRVIKSEAEIACMEKASEIISETFVRAVPRIKAGMTELEIQAEFEAEMLRLGAESYVQAFAPMIATGEKRSHISMIRNSTRKVGESEILNIAAGACYEGYNSIICSPVVLGKIPDEIRDAVKCAYDALNVAAENLKPGTTADVVLNAYTDYLDKAGYLNFCPYGSLHSTGMLECEAPVFTIANKREIKEGMAICIDAYFKGLPWGSFRIEDTYIITATGAKRLTTYNDTYLTKMFNI